MHASEQRTDKTAKEILIENKMGSSFQVWQKQQDKHNQLVCILTLNQELAFSQQ